MKHGLLILTVILPFTAWAQVASVADGDWYDPNTWDCNCIPGQNSILQIGHEITLDQDVTHNGPMTIVPGGSLDVIQFDQHSLWQQGELINEGVIHASAIVLGSAGRNALNNGVINVRDGFTFLGDTLWNNGSIYFTLGPGVFHLTGTVINRVHMMSAELLNDAEVFNSGEFLFLNATVSASGSIYNTANLGLVTAMIDGTVVVDSAGLFHGENQTVNGTVELRTDSSMYRIGPEHFFDQQLVVNGTIKGAGGICVTDASSYNYGQVLDSVDICHLLDWTGVQIADTFTVNTGFISPWVTGCMNPLCGTIGTGVPQVAQRPEVVVQPVPSDGRISVSFGGLPIDRYIVRNALGATVVQGISMPDPSLELVLRVDPGIYLLELRFGSRTGQCRIVIDR